MLPSIGKHDKRSVSESRLHAPESHAVDLSATVAVPPTQHQLPQMHANAPADEPPPAPGMLPQIGQQHRFHDPHNPGAASGMGGLKIDSKPLMASSRIPVQKKHVAKPGGGAKSKPSVSQLGGLSKLSGPSQPSQSRNELDFGVGNSSHHSTGTAMMDEQLSMSGIKPPVSSTTGPAKSKQYQSPYSQRHKKY